MSAASSENTLFGLMAEFDEPDALLTAARAAYEEGYRVLDAYTPFPMEEVAEAIHVKRNRLPLIVLIGGIIGGLAGFFMQYYSAVIHYPLNVGGRPLNSWPAFIPITFEMTILFAAFAAILGMFALNGLPQPYHPTFNVPEFVEATEDKFFLLIGSDDENFELEKTRTFFHSVDAIGIFEVEP